MWGCVSEDRVLYWYLLFVSFQLSINGDKEFLDNAHKVNPYHLSPVMAMKQSEGSQEAGPLPVKVDLSKTCV